MVCQSVVGCVGLLLVVGCVGLLLKGAKCSSRTRRVVHLLALVVASLLSQRSLTAQLAQSNGKVIFTAPATSVGTSSAPQNLLLKTTSAISITSFTLPLSQGSKQEYTVGTVTGCTVDGATVVPAGTTCTVPITFTPAYPGMRAVPLRIVTSGGNVTIGLAGSGVSPLAAITPGIMSTIAGDVNASGCAAYNGPATQGPQCNPSGVAVDAAGNVYIVSFLSNTVSKIDPSGNVTVIAGTGAGGVSGINGPAIEANIERPADVVIDPAGNVYFADESAQQVFRIDAVTQILTSVAGNGTQGYSGDGGQATLAELNRPEGVALDLQGNLYIEDQDNNLIRKVDTSGVITTVAGDPTTAGQGDPTYGGDGGPAIKAGLALCCAGVAASYDSIGVDASGNLFIGDSGHHVIRKVTTDGIIHTVAGNNALGAGFSGDGGPAKSAQLNEPMGVAVDAAGDIYIADFFNNRIRKVDAATQVISTVAGNGSGTFAGDGGPATLASLDGPQKVELDGLGNLYIGDTKNYLVRKVTVMGPTLTFVTPTLDGTTDTTDGPLGVIVSDIGNATLTLDKPDSGLNPTISANFSLFTGETGACPTLTSSSASATIAEGASCALDVNFTPLAIGPLTGSLVLTDNSLNTSSPAASQTISFAGTGTAAAIASLAPTSLAFPSTTIAVTSAAMTTKLSNTGTATLNISGITITGMNAANFAETSTCTATLAAGSNCVISVTFTPSVTGAANATLNVADDAAGSPQTVDLAGTGAAAPPSITETGNLWFNPAPVAIAAPSAQTLTATFTITGETSLIAPTAKMHYGLAYKVGAVSCTGTAGNQTCTVPVTFIPNYPGGRKDALFLMNGTTRLATQLAYGVGKSPFALVQPGIVTNPILSNNGYLYDSTVDENGTLYILETENNAILSVTAAGVVTTLPVTGLSSPRGVGIDGAGILYIADQKPENSITTYDTVQGVQGGIPYPSGAFYVQNVTAGNEGNVYATDSASIYTIKPDGTTSSVAISPANTQANRLTVDSNEDLFIGGYAINEITAGGTQTQINTAGAGDGLSVDAALTLYACRYSGSGSDSVGELPASGYGTEEAVLDSTANPLGCSDGPDGTLYVGNYTNLDKVDRSQGAPIAFGEQSNGSPSQPAAFQIYNGGNETLTLATFAVTGEGFAIQTGTTSACKAGMTIAPGALCNAPIIFTGTHSGNFTGTITFTSNTLNTTATSVSVPLSAYVNGIYVTAVPSPLNFGKQTEGTTSVSKTVTFTNTGVNADASIGTPSSVAGFTVSQGTCTANIAPGSSCLFDVTFSPTAAQAYTGTVNVTASSNSSTQQQTLSFTVNGTGTPAALPPPPAVANLQFAPAIVNLVAGDFAGAYTGDGGPATAATLNRPYGIAYDAAGNLYIADSENFVIRKVDTTGKISTFAGNGTQWVSGSDGDNGPALSAKFSNPTGVAVDAAGNVYIADQGENVVRKIDTTGTITLFAGSSTGNSGYGGDGGPATSSLLYEPIGLAFDAVGNLYIADSNNEVVRKVDTSSNIHTFAGNGTPGYSGDGGAATSAKLARPIGVAADPAGNIYIADNGNFVFRVVSKTNVITTFAGSGALGTSCPAGSAPTSCTFAYPSGVAASPAGDIYLSDSQGGGIFVVDKANKAYPVEQNLGGALSSLFIGGSDFFAGTYGPNFITLDSNGQVIASNYEAQVVTSAGATGILTFPKQNVGTTSSALFIQLTNPGAVALTFSGTPTITGPYAIGGGTCDLTKGIAVGADCTLGVTFTPTAPGLAIPGTIVLASNASNTPSTIQLSGDGVATPLTSTLLPASLTFTTTVNTTSAAQTSIFTNTGTSAISITGITVSAGSGFTESDDCGTSLAGGKACTISVTFSPTQATAYSGTVTVASDSTSDGTTISLAGTGTAAPAPIATLSPTSLAFPSTALNTTSAVMTSKLTNTGNAVLNISGITLAGLNPTDFAETNTCNATLAAGANCIISVTFTPTTSTNLSAAINVADNAVGSPQGLAVSGTGLGGVTASPASIAFGDEEEYTENFQAQKITITNTSSSTITFGTLVFSPDFVLYQDDCGSQLLGDSSCYYLVSFFPKGVGNFTGNVSIPFTGSTGSPLTVSFTGTGTAATPEITLVPAPVNFGTVPVGVPVTPIAVDVQASGYAPLTGITASISGKDAAEFSQTNNCAGVTIYPYGQGGGDCKVTVSFLPAAAGLQTATLTVTSNSGAATTTTTISGGGIAQPSQLQFTPTQLNLIAGAGGPCADATTGGLATAATLCNVTGTTQDYLGNTYLVDNTYNVVYKVDTAGTISVFAGTPSKTGGYTGDGGPATKATLSGPTAVAADAFGDIFISDTANSAIREVDITGTITSFIDGTCGDDVAGKPFDRHAAPRSAQLHPHEIQLCETLRPEGLVVDSSGNVIFADTLNNVVLESNITTGGSLLVAGDAEGIQGTAGYNGDNIAADGAELNAPQDVAVDPAGNVYIADTLNYRIRKVTVATGIITTVAGNGTQGDTGDGAAATSAEITPYGVGADLAGDLFITPGTGGIVRKVDASGNISVFAGNGTGPIGGVASTGAVANAYFARTDNNGDLLIPAGTQLLAAGPDGLLQFGTETIGTTSSALDVTLENTGDAYLHLGTTIGTITGADVTDFAISGSNCGYTLVPGNTCTVSVTFDPTVSGARTASLSIPTGAAGSPQIVLLQGNGTVATSPAASLSPTTISFPDTTVGSTATAVSTTLSNTGTAVLNISGITITGANPTDFAETTTCGTTLAAGSTCTISVTFTPAAAASYTASISVADNATGSPQTAGLSGTGTAAPAPIASLSPATLTFPATIAGSTATALTTTLSNTGNAVLNISGITLTGANPTDFALTTTGTTCGTTLAAGSTCTISATFTPTAAGSFTATISVADNAAASPQTATLTGTGNPAPATDFTLTATPPAQTIAAGGVAQFNVTTTGIGGPFESVIQFTATGLPSGFTATFSPSSVTPGANGASSVLSIQTTSQTALSQPHPLHRGPSPWFPVSLAAFLVVPLLGLRKRLGKQLLSCLLLVGALAPVFMLTGCGGGYYSLQSKTYTVTVTGTSGSTQHSTTVTLTVQQ